jgi:signal transduction histidine kinase
MLVVLCVAFIISIGATTYSLIAEKRIAIDFARKELVGTRYLRAVHGVYAAILAAPPFDTSAAPSDPSTDVLLETIAAAQATSGAGLQTRELEEALARAVRLWSGNSGGTSADALDVLAKARALIARIADDSNLALDPDLDSYHLQDLIARKLPAFLRQLGKVRILSRRARASARSTEHEERIQIQESLLRSTADEVRENLAASYRGNPDGRLRRAIDGAFTAMLSSTNAYLGDSVAGGTGAAGSEPQRGYGTIVQTTMAAWATAQSELDVLLHKRIDALVERMRWALALTAALAGLSIVIAVMTHRHIVRPLQRLEHVASTVRETKDYSVRMDYTSKNDVGQVAAAFNDMLSELAAARERERTEQAELARVARLTTMGALTASIAHEVSQPLAAMVTNSNAALRWLSNAPPDLDEVRRVLKNIISDGHRAGQVIGGVRTMFRKDGRERSRLAVNDLIEDILALVHGEIGKHRVLVRTELRADLPSVTADRTQLQQVFMNLIINAVEAMAAVTNRDRLLVVKTDVHDPDTVMISVEDSGTGIDPNDTKRIFEAFYTTKSDGMGMGLSICRSIIEAHGGRLWAAPGVSWGSVFYVVLPSTP